MTRRRTTVGRYAVAIVTLLGCVYIASAQQVVDKTVAVVRDASRSELITYSDLLWQLALQPGTPLDPPSSQDLNRALETLINQRLFALEAKRLPRAAPTQKEIADEIQDTLAKFPSTAAFESRLRKVGFQSVSDEGFQRLISERLAIKKYVDFRFRSFVVVTADEEKQYYQDIYIPEFRRRAPGLLVPTLDERRREIHDTLIEQKVASSIERFLEESKARTVVEMLSTV